MGREGQDKAYPELVDSPVVLLRVAASEVGGRLNEVGVRLLREAAAARARSEPAFLRAAAARRWQARWSAMLSVCVQDCTGATLVDDGTCILSTLNGAPPISLELWIDARAEA